MNSRFDKYRLMAPGPVALSKAALEALAKPMIHHRTPEFRQILERVLKGLKDVFQTSQPVLMHTATGSGAMESAIVNTLSPGDEVLVIVSGKFGERWLAQCQAYGIKATALNVAWGKAVDPADVKAHLTKHPQTKGVLTQACETSTATLHPIKEIAQVVKEHPQCLLMVDAITALGAMEFYMDQWGLDVVVAGSQKAFMLPTGLSFIALSEKAWEAQELSRCPKFYFDLKKELTANKNGETYFSSSISLVRALDAVLPTMTGENLKRLIRRISSLAEATREGGKKLGLKVFSGSPSPSVTALVVPESVNGSKLRSHIEEKYNITVMGGQDQLKGKILRVGHLGAIDAEDTVLTLEAIGLALIDLGHTQIQPKDVEAAKQWTENFLADRL